MSSFLCFVCHSTVNDETCEETREKYREVVGMNLCPDFHLCHICCHVLNRLWLFRSVCVKRSLEYPVLFSEKGTLNLQRNYLECHAVCGEDTCEHFKNRNLNSKFYDIRYIDKHLASEKDNENNEYVELNEERDFDEFVPKLDEPIDNFISDIYENDNFNDTENNEADNDDDNSYVDYEDMNNDCNNVEDVNNDIQLNNVTDNEVNENSDVIENEVKVKKKSKSKQIKKKFEKVMLRIEEQKAELEANRKSKKYIEAEFKCSNCGIGFLFKDTYQAHMMRHEESNGEFRCNICTLRFANSAVLRAHKCLHGERYRCLNCGVMIKKRQRTAHAKECYGIEMESASCHLCGRVFKDGPGLQQHIKRYHRSNARSYACNVCGQRCSGHAALRTHMIKHIQKKFPCDICQALFSSPYTLKQHVIRHTSRELVTCDICGLTYSGKKSLRNHVKNVHLRDRDVKRPTKRSVRPRPVRPSPPAVCHLCGAIFKGNSKLNRHLRQVCEKNRLEEELSSYYLQEDVGI